MEVFHYGLGRHCRLGYQLIEDGLRYEDYPEVVDPTLIIHGSRDQVVAPRYSQEFTQGRPHVTLRLLDSDHQLLDVLEPAWDLVQDFLDLC